MVYHLRKRRRTKESEDSKDPSVVEKGTESEDPKSQENTSQTPEDQDAEDLSSDDEGKDDDDFIVEDTKKPKPLIEHLLENIYGHPDDDWTDGLTEDEVAKLKPVYDSLQQKLADETPTIAKILEANLTESEKKRCLQLYDGMNSNLPGTMAYYELRNEIIDILERSQSSHNIETLQQEEARLKALLTDTESLKQKILALKAPDSVKSNLYGKYLRLERMDVTDVMYSTLKDQIDWSISLPYDTRFNLKVEDNPQAKSEFLAKFSERLDKELYGMNPVKERLILLLNNSLNSKNAKKSVALCGPPGTGKTAVAQAFAKSLGAPFEHISLGGARDSTMFYGSDNVYVGAGPGIIVRTLCNMKCSDGVILFDEIDKLAATAEGLEMQYALLHITDYLQNKKFRDKYLSEKIDISNLWFFYSMNTKNSLDKALVNRLSIIELQAYTFNEKIIMIENFVLPSVLENLGMPRDSVTMTRDAFIKLLNLCPEDDGGVRGVGNIIEPLMSKVNLYRTVGNVERLGRKFSFKIENFMGLPLHLDADQLGLLLEKNVRQDRSYFS